MGINEFKIERVTPKTENYTQMMNYHLQDKSLSLKAKGLMSLVLSLDDKTWTFSIAGLAAICKDGVDSIKAAMQELRASGYLETENKRIDGRFYPTKYTFHEKSIKGVSSIAGKPLRKLQQGNAILGKRPQLNTDETNAKKSKNQSIDRERLIDDIKRQIDYDLLLKKRNLEGYHSSLKKSYQKSRIDKLINTITFVLSSNEKTIRVNKENVPTSDVQAIFRELNLNHVESVLKRTSNSHTQINDERAYLVTALYNTGHGFSI